MKNILFALLTISLIACKSGANSEPASDVAGLKKQLSEKQATLKSLQVEIKNIEAQLNKLEPPKEKTALVTLDTVEVKTFDRFTDLQGTIMSDEVVNASSEIGGRLLSVRVKEGDEVRRGQLVATVDIETMEKQKAEIESSLSLAKTVFEKQKKLWDQKIGSEVQYLQAKNNVERLEKSLETMASGMAKRNVYAPANGIVDMQYLKPGELAAPGMPIVSILNVAKVKVVADVPENYLGKIRKGDKVAVSFPAIEKEVTRAVTLVGRSIDPANRTFKIEMMTDNLGNTLKPNLLSVVKFKDLSIAKAVALPVELIQEEVDGQKYIFIAVNENGKLIAKKQFVTTGETSLNDIQITDGLKAGDVVVVLGARSITEGDILIDDSTK